MLTPLLKEAFSLLVNFLSSAAYASWLLGPRDIIISWDDGCRTWCTLLAGYSWYSWLFS